MPAALELTCQIDSQRLERAVKERIQFPGRTEAQICNTAAFWIAVNTKNATPFVTVDRIDTELAVESSFGKTPKGRVSKAKKNFVLRGTIGGVGRSTTMPLSTLIVLARSNPGSNYNRLTNSRYAIPSLRGLSKSEFWSRIAATESRMIKARHSSIHFLQSGWVRAVRTLYPFSVNKWRKGDTSPQQDVKWDRGGEERGSAIPAKEGSDDVFATISNATGMRGDNRESFNQALWQHGLPALNAAIQKEAVLMEDYSRKAYQVENEKFNRACK